MAKDTLPKEKYHLRQVSSGVKFIQTCWSGHGITFSHSTMHTKGNNSRLSDKDLRTPSVFIFFMPVGVQKTTPPPVSTLCALSEPPVTLVSFVTGLDGSTATSRVPPLQEQLLSSLKGQWCYLEAFSTLSISLLNNFKQEELYNVLFMPRIWNAQS